MQAPSALLFGHEKSHIRDAAEMGLRRLGFDIQIQIPGPWSPADAIRSADAVVVVGLRGRAGDAARYYAAKDIPVAMIDLAHLRHTGGVNQLRVTGPAHDWLPTFEGGDRAPHDRIDALGIEIGDRRRVKGQHILLVGQLSGDSAHGMSRSEFTAWAEGAVARLRSLTDSAIVWRPHPSEFYPLAGVDGISDPREESLAAALEKTWLVVTYNSTAGLEALIAGLPVIAEGPAIYGGLTSAMAEWQRVAAPAKENLRELLAKVAYTQWTDEEIRGGMPLEVALGRVRIPAAAEAPKARRAKTEPAETAPEPVAQATLAEPEPVVTTPPKKTAGRPRRRKPG